MYSTVICRATISSGTYSENKKSLIQPALRKKVGWFSFIYLTSLISFTALGGSMRMLLTYF